MKIRVTKQDIELGRPNKGYFCPISLATSRELPNYRIYVGRLCITLMKEEEIKEIIQLPNEATTFIERFDEECEDVKVQPFEFEICPTLKQ